MNETIKSTKPANGFIDVFRRSLTTASWLGWKIESNWTDPFLFAVYSIIKPLAGAAIIVVMYSVIAQGNYNTPYFAYLYFGNAFYQYVSSVMTGVSWSIVDDREHYKTLKYMYIAPIQIPAYLMGRGVARIFIGTISVLITILAGVFFLHVPFQLAAVNWPLFIVTLVLGIIVLINMGLMLAGVTLMLARHSDFVGDAVSSAMFLFTGAIFPLTSLPAVLRPIGYALPITYWLELIRRALIGTVVDTFPTFAAFSNLQLLGILATFAVVLGVISSRVFHACEYRARERGLIDRVTNY
jgi:ABC-2 type transport system permease protein